jgi:hypothetical protein
VPPGERRSPAAWRFGTFAAAVVATGGECGGVADEVLDGDEVGASVEEILLQPRHPVSPAAIRATIPEPADQRANRLRRGRRGERPPAFDAESYKQRNVVERAIKLTRPAGCWTT